jgi:predicted DsbA family dithiol-disulfide isomerase
MSDPATAETVRGELRDADSVGIFGTPMFVIGVHKPGEKTVRAVRMIEGAQPYDVFKATLEGVLRARTP